MNHLDEGTIHAWLDGALDAEQSRAADAHVHACPQCANAVAEARGLMAASSRILGALDDVPAGVIPAAPVKRARPMWRAAPWVTGIAALFVGAVVLSTSDTPRSADLASTPPAAFGDTMPGTVASAPAAGTPSPTATVVAPRAQVAQTPAAPPRAAAARRPVAGEVAGGGSIGAAAVTPAPAEVTVTAGADLQHKMSAERAQDAVAAPAPPRDTHVSHSRIAGCYVVATGPRERFVQELARRGAAADARRQAPVAAAAPAQDGPANRLIVRLDSVLERQGYRVRDARADTAIGWWSPVQADSARVDLQMLGVAAVLTARDRIICPER